MKQKIIPSGSTPCMSTLRSVPSLESGCIMRFITFIYEGEALLSEVLPKRNQRAKATF